MNAIGEAYRSGRGVSADEPEGERRYQRAYRAGSKRAMLNYGHVLAQKADLTGSEAVFREGAEGWAPAMYWLATILLDHGGTTEHRAEAKLLLERATGLGNPKARWKLIHLMIRGRFGLQNIPRAVGMIWTFAKELTAASEREQAKPATGSGETLH